MTPFVFRSRRSTSSAFRAKRAYRAGRRLTSELTRSSPPHILAPTCRTFPGGSSNGFAIRFWNSHPTRNTAASCISGVPMRARGDCSTRMSASPRSFSPWDRSLPTVENAVYQPDPAFRRGRCNCRHTRGRAYKSLILQERNECGRTVRGPVATADVREDFQFART